MKIRNKRILIYLTGKADSPFFYSEIEDLIQAFDKVYVITYKDNPDTIKYIENKYHIKIFLVKVGIKSLFYFPVAARALVYSDISDELHYINKEYSGKSKILCMGYALYYIIFALGVRKKLKPILKENRSCDAYLYSFWMSKAAFSLAMFDYKKYSNVRTIVSRAHGYDLYEERNQIGYLPFRKFIAESLDKILFISCDGKKYFRQCIKKQNICVKDMEVIHMGVNSSNYTKKYSYKDEIVIASCSSVIKVKRLDLIIDFIQIISSKIKIRWFHIGDGILMENIKNLAEKELLDVQVQFLGNIDNKKIIGIYEKKDVDFFINMSDSEGIPVSIMEAFSAGIPVIARNVGGISEIVNDETGFLVESLDRKYLEKTAERIIQYFQDKTKYSLLSKNALAMQEQNYERKTNNLKLIKAIKGES